MRSVPKIFTDAFLEAQKLFPNGAKTCLEFGVGAGNSYLWQAEQIIKHFNDTTLIGFDSWAGLPKETKGVWYPKRHGQGNFSFPKSAVLGELQKMGIRNDPRFRFVDGFFDKSLTKEVQRTISNLVFVNIDVDVHSSSLLVLDFIKPHLRNKVIIYWDDWKDPKDGFEGKWGEHLAWEEWSRKNPEIRTKTLAVNEFNQRYMKVIAHP
ncbi:MAG TPA: class I SAM-dependent methyltransferase [Patescibacteria group bacterium]|nr:class I SAM-dependent methyltransferase [Patescibacteria group bacterium]